MRRHSRLVKSQEATIFFSSRASSIGPGCIGLADGAAPRTAAAFHRVARHDRGHRFRDKTFGAGWAQSASQNLLAQPWMSATSSPTRAAPGRTTCARRGFPGARNSAAWEPIPREDITPSLRAPEFLRLLRVPRPPDICRAHVRQAATGHPAFRVTCSVTTLLCPQTERAK